MTRPPRGPTELDKFLADLRGNQAAKRTRVYDQTELTELRAAKRLAWELFGSKGVVEFPCDFEGQRLGGLVISYFLAPPDPTRPKQIRPTRQMFRGATYAELFAQVQLWRAKGRS